MRSYRTPEDLEKASPLPAVLFLAPSHASAVPRCLSAGRTVPIRKMAVRAQAAAARPGSQAGSLRLAGCCEGGCVSGLSAGHSACWFWGRRSSQSKQAAAPPWALDRLLGLMRSCLVARSERHACTGKCGDGSACSVGVQCGRRLGVPQGWPAPSLPTLYLAIPVFQGSAHLLGGSPFPST